MTLFWLAVHTHATKEALADYWLRRRGFETFFPHMKVSPHWRAKAQYDSEGNYIGKSKILSELRSVKPLVQRYVFVRSPVDRVCEINSSQGVSTVVYSPGGGLMPIPEEGMSRFKEELKDSGEVYAHMTPADEFGGAIGDMVKGKEGWPHWNLVAQVTRLCGTHVAVKMMMLGSSDREVLVPANSIERVAS